ncbi:putative Ribose-phosphate pyrophosphokinase [Blattamonas nauphoetae]|uniref:ribose-phosphate diphosphokinase n=1 Tax=Blattamonas nauphoetae TaxID=2049346 RepID=A0ABQ9XBX3_9EUKA|nr:putative Ribose-phosphate pyrophosphokinase [Blattamonas nauphoetae]
MTEEDSNQIYLLVNASSKYFGDLLRKHLESLKIIVTPLEIIKKTYSNGEKLIRIDIENPSDLFGKDCIYVSALLNDSDFMDLFRIGSSLSSFGTRSRIFVIPFLGYSTMERATKFGEVVTCKANLRLLSQLPSYGIGNSFLFMDLHVSGILHYFEGSVLRAELYGQDVLTDGLKQCGLEENSMFATADLGRPKWVEAFAKSFKTDIALVRKTRDGTNTEVKNVIGDVKGKHVIIYDDMTRSGGTLIHAADGYMEHGALSVSCILSHLALTTESVVDSLNKSCLTRIISTNSHPFTQRPHLNANIYSSTQTKITGSKFHVFDCSYKFAEAIRDILRPNIIHSFVGIQNYSTNVLVPYKQFPSPHSPSPNRLTGVHISSLPTLPDVQAPHPHPSVAQKTGESEQITVTCIDEEEN